MAAEPGVPPTRLSFTVALALIRDTLGWMGGERFTYGDGPATFVGSTTSAQTLAAA